MKQRIAVALSGGVDSAVAAARLVEDGHDVVGVHGREWSATWAGPCASADDLTAARAVAEHLGIPFHVVPCAEAYRSTVFSEVLNELAAGRTPNPDVLCNRRIKFGVLAHAARELGATVLATGHYARKVGVGAQSELHLSADAFKDQTYFLCELSPEQLAFAAFPLEASTKAAVRQEARARELPVAERAESMGLCFLGTDRYAHVVSGFLPSSFGSIRDTTGRVLGTHPGLHRFTLGQRRGIELSGGPYYVAAKEVKTNTLVVAAGRDHPALFRRSATVVTMRWMSQPLRGPTRVRVRFRHQQTFAPATAVPEADGGIRVYWDAPAWAPTPGQTLMLVLGTQVLGGGSMSDTTP